MKFFRKLTSFAGHPITMCVVGAFLVASSLAELGETLFSGEPLQNEHGTLLFGVLLTLKSLGEIGEGLGKMDEGLNHEHTK